MPSPREQAERIGTDPSKFTGAAETGASNPDGGDQNKPPKERDYAADPRLPKDPAPPARVSSK